MTEYTPREIEQFQVWAKIKQIEDLIIILTSEKNKLKSHSKVIEQEVLE